MAKIVAAPNAAAFFTTVRVTSQNFLAFVANHVCDWAQEEIIGASVSTNHAGTSILSYEVVPKNFKKLMAVSLGSGVVGYGLLASLVHSYPVMLGERRRKE